jgi:hypothetical protein
MHSYLLIALIALAAVILAKMILPRVPGLQGIAGLL